MNRKIITIFLLTILLISAFVYASRSKNLVPSNKIQITTSFYPLYFFASQIGGDKVNVSNITPPSAEPHDYEPTTQDIVKISGSRMLILNGGHLEAWGDKIKDQLSDTKVLIVIAGEGLANQKITEEGKTIQDPHVWLDPSLAKKELENIERGFEKMDPASKSYYKANQVRLEKELDGLDQQYKKDLFSCIKGDFVTSHAAFGYLARAYGLNQVPISGISPDQEPSAKKLAEVADLVKRENIKVIFFESLVSPKLSQTIAHETGASAMVLDPIEGIVEKDQKAGRNYISVMKDNLVALRKALECK